MNKYMKEAIEEAQIGIRFKHGGPFGSVIVKDGVIVGRGHNKVLKNNDPTAHGEISAIRDACKNLNTYDLTGCEIYTTGEPCPMCLCAIKWANISKVYYGCTLLDNERIGFRDAELETVFQGREKLGSFLTEVDKQECLELFDEYAKSDAKRY